jgi:hypothetical protein
VLDVAFIEQDKRAKVFIGLDGNFFALASDRAIVEAALRRLRLIVAISTKLNRGHVVHGKQALILPCLARSDIDLQKTGRQSISVEDSMSMVRASSGLVHPPSEYPKSEVSIVCAIAKATLLDGLIDWSAFEENYDLIRGRSSSRCCGATSIDGYDNLVDFTFRSRHVIGRGTRRPAAGTSKRAKTRPSLRLLSCAWQR